MDFLTNRSFKVDIDGELSNLKKLKLGCVQGSILGPKLFNLYMRDVSSNVNGHHITTYADDSYVLVKAAVEDLQEELQNTVTKHLDYLNVMGMVSNLSKTEAVLFDRGRKQELEIEIGGEVFRTAKEMKVLGVTLDDKISWSSHISKVVSKAKNLNSALSFIRRKLSEDQFLKVLTSQFYGACFYGSAAWLHGNNSYKDIRKINAVYYRSLRIAKRDFKRKLSRSKLDEMGRARPTTWARYQSTSIVMKATTRKLPERLCVDLLANSYHERRKPKRMKFYNKANLRIGKQSLPNRCGTDINDLDFDWTDGMTDNLLRISLKKHFKMNNDLK